MRAARRSLTKMASGYSESGGSDSRFQSEYRRYGQRLPTRRRGTYFPGHIPRSSDYCWRRRDDETNRDLNSLSSRDEERIGRPRDHFDKFREKHVYDHNTSSTGNSEDFFHSERRSAAERVQIERGREERIQDKLGNAFSYNNEGRQHASGLSRANNSPFLEREELNWRDKSDSETTCQNFYSHRGRGGRGRGRARERKLFSNTEENPFQLDWREGLTDTSKA